MEYNNNNSNNFREDIKELQEKSNTTKTDLRVLESKSEDRHIALMDKIDVINSDMQRMSNRLDTELFRILSKIEELNSLANQGKTSLKTLWFIGGLAASILAFLATWSDVFNKG